MTLILLFLSVLCASIPMILFLVVIWWLDRYDREPIWLVGLIFMWGAIGAIAGALITGTPSMWVLRWLLGNETATILSPVIIAPITEEITKGIILFAVVRSRHFDNVTDGFVYGAAAGLGFGMTENFLYFMGSIQGGPAAWLYVVVVRTLFSAVMHATATATVGAALGLARFRRIPVQIPIVAAGFGLAMGMHALWNGLIVASIQKGEAMAHVANFGILPVEVIVVSTVFLLSVHSEKRLIRRNLRAEAKRGLLPAAHAKVLTSMIQRSKSGWLEPGIPQGLYVKAATRLAFKMDQARRAPEPKRTELRKEVSGLRAEVHRLRSLAT
jgi:RsiW-degrading membrane proteinase PrsW (M82 family)